MTLVRALKNRKEGRKKGREERKGKRKRKGFYTDDVTQILVSKQHLNRKSGFKMIENVRQRKKELKEGGQGPAGMCAGDRLPPPPTHTADGLNLVRRGLKTFPP